VLIMLAAVLALVLTSDGVSSAQKAGDAGKPSLALKAAPGAGFTPLKVRLTVDVRGGADDAVDFYCPAIEWQWGDEAISASESDCAPYEPGKSEIRRRYSVEHTYREPGEYRVVFRLKQKDRVVATATTQIQARPGARDGFGY